MPIPGVSQPELIPISDDLRLRRFDGNYDMALPWYQDAETLRLVDGKEDPYTPARIKRMYDYLGEHGELYWIEAWMENGFRPIGDVTFWREDMPIVIGEKDFRGKGIGRRVVAALCCRARELGYERIYVDEIYDFNIGSRRCFESAGFIPCEKTEKGARYVLRLEKPVREKEIVTFTNMCMVVDGDRVLVQDRLASDWPGITFPGGHVEPGESFADAVIREVKEETGLTVFHPALVGVKDWTDENARYVVLLYRAEEFAGDLHSSEEGEVFWLALDELPKQNLALDMMDILKVFMQSDLSEFFYEKDDDGNWSYTLK